MTLLEIARPEDEALSAAERGDGQNMRAISREDSPVAEPSARPTGPRDQAQDAGGGIAHTTSVAHSRSGDPTPFDRTGSASGQDDGLTVSGDHASSAVVPLSEPAKVLPTTTQTVRTRGGGHKKAAATHSEQALGVASPSALTPARGRARSTPDTPSRQGAAKSKAPALEEAASADHLPERGDGHPGSDARSTSAVATQSRRPNARVEPIGGPAGEGDGHPNRDAPSSLAVAAIVDLWRQRQDLRRAEGRLILQAQAVCRRALGGDKEAAGKLWKAIRKGASDRPDVAVIVEPYRLTAATLDGFASGLEKELAKRVRKLPLWTGWAKDVRGLGELSIAGLIGEASGNPGDYRSVSALWKRFGLAVFDGERQRRHSDPQMALLHGYAPQRRAFAYVLSANLMKSQRAEDPFRVIYDRRKAYELARDIPKAHAHNRALRVMVKALLKDCWTADRRLRQP